MRLTQRDFVRYSAGMIAGIYLGAMYTGCGNGNGDTTSPEIVEWPIEDDVFTTAQRQVLHITVSESTPEIDPSDLTLYSQYGYSDWETGSGLPCTLRLDLMAPGYAAASNGSPDIGT